MFYPNNRGKANVVIQKSKFYHISKKFNKKKKKLLVLLSERMEWTIGGQIDKYSLSEARIATCMKKQS